MCPMQVMTSTLTPDSAIRSTSPSCSLIAVGAFAGAFGVRGEVRIRSFCEIREDIALYQPLYAQHGEKEFRFRVVQSLKSELVAKVEGVNTREQAHNLKGQQLFASRDKFPPTDDEEFYWADLTNLLVVDTSGNEFGKVTNVVNFGAGDLLEVLSDTGETIQIPFTKAVVPEVNLMTGTAVVDWNLATD